MLPVYCVARRFNQGGGTGINADCQDSFDGPKHTSYTPIGGKLMRQTMAIRLSCRESRLHHSSINLQDTSKVEDAPTARSIRRNKSMFRRRKPVEEQRPIMFVVSIASKKETTPSDSLTSISDTHSSCGAAPTNKRIMHSSRRPLVPLPFSFAFLQLLGRICLDYSKRSICFWALRFA